ncbi:MAG: mechanosensitive ion channel [Anaerolineales bacterium]|nr:mechanosensitive ion channel [Anaerolineales bacterium]
MIDFELVQNAVSEMIVGAVSYTPRLLTTLLILLLGWLIARVLGAVVKRLADRFHLQSLLARTGVQAGLERAEIKKSGADLLYMFVFWIIFLNFILIGLEHLGLDTAVEPLRNLIAFLPRLLAALATLTAGILLAQFLGRAAQAALSGMDVEFHAEVGQGVNILLIIMVVIVVLEQLGINATILTTVFTNVLTIVIGGLALAFGLGGRGVVRNVLAGYYAREQFGAGDIIMVNGEVGSLEGIGTLNAEIRVGDELLIVPNTRLTETAVRITNTKSTEKFNQ